MNHFYETKSRNVSLIIPAYNEVGRLDLFLKSVAEWSETKALISELIIVDDGSIDKTSEVAYSFLGRLPKLKVIKHASNQGKGAAVQTGVMAAQGDLIIFMDADGATPISDLPIMIQALAKADIGVGNRWMLGAKTERHSILRRLSGHIYRRYMGLYGLGDVDTMCGFKGYRRAAARNLFSDLLEKRWLFDSEIAYKAVCRGYSVSNFPINWTSMDGSKLDIITLLKSAFNIWPLLKKIKKRERNGCKK